MADRKEEDHRTAPTVPSAASLLLANPNRRSTTAAAAATTRTVPPQSLRDWNLSDVVSLNWKTKKNIHSSQHHSAVFCFDFDFHFNLTTLGEHPFELAARGGWWAGKISKKFHLTPFFFWNRNIFVIEKKKGGTC